MTGVEVQGVAEIPDQKTVPFFVVQIREVMEDTYSKEKFLLRAGEGQSFEKFSRSMLDGGLGHDFCLQGEGRLKHCKGEKKIIIYSMPGPTEKLTYKLLKEKFPDYHTIWRDG